MRAIWLLLGCVSFIAGLIGAFLPLLPTVPLMLLSAFFFARSSERLHNWLLTHPRFGAAIIDWHERGAISRRAKKLAVASIVATFAISLALGLAPVLLVIQGAVLLGVLLFILSRPSA